MNDVRNFIATQAFIDAKDTYLDRTLAVRDEMAQTGALPSKIVMADIQKLYVTMRTAGGHKSYSKTWKDVEAAVREEASDRINQAAIS